MSVTRGSKLQESLSRCKYKPDPGQNCQTHFVFEVFRFFWFSAQHCSKRASQASETTPEGPKKGPNEPKRAPNGPQGSPGGPLAPDGVRRRPEVSRAKACLISGESGGQRTPCPKPGPPGRRSEQVAGRTPGGVVWALRKGEERVGERIAETYFLQTTRWSLTRRTRWGDGSLRSSRQPDVLALRAFVI